MMALLVLSVDVGRLSLARSELQGVADAAACAAMGGLDDGSWVAKAKAAAAANRVDGRAAGVADADVTVGAWDAATRTFTPGGVNAHGFPNAVRVVARLGPGQPNDVTGTFAASLGGAAQARTATAIATGGELESRSLDARANPWYAGMNATPSSAGTAPLQVPITVSPGQVLRVVSGGWIYDYGGNGNGNSNGNGNGGDDDDDDGGGSGPFGPDGNASIVKRYALAQNGISNVNAPENSVIGVFLGPDAPNLTAMPAELDFATAASRDYASVSPLLKQAFFVGNGIRADGVTYQTIVVPPGATRLFLGTHESDEHYTNLGQFVSYTASRSTKLSLVR